MEVEDIVEKYRGVPNKKRWVMVALVALLPALFHLYEEGDSLSAELEQARSNESAERGRLESAKRKVAELPALLAKVSEIEAGLEKAKKILPDNVAIDTILATLGQFEADLDVSVLRFVPGTEVQPNTQIEYKEVPVELTVQSSFPQVMRFYDKILHMQTLTHLRAIEFNKVEANDENAADSGKIESRAKLILFKGL